MEFQYTNCECCGYHLNWTEIEKNYFEAYCPLCDKLYYKNKSSVS